MAELPSLGGTVSIRPYAGPEKAFEPTDKRVDFELKPLLEPEPIEFQRVAFERVEGNPLIVDIETTGAEPWDSKIICIGVLDPRRAEIQPEVILEETEEETVKGFLEYFRDGQFTEIIGYNVAFDYRFIFAACMRYRLQAADFIDSKIYDLMQSMKQVKHEFVFGFNKPGKLEDWAKYLWGLEKTMTYPELLAAWAKKDLKKIVEYNANDLVLTYAIWTLDQYVKEKHSIKPPKKTETASNPATRPEASHESSSGDEASEMQKVECPVCLQEHQIPEGATDFQCGVCDETRKL